jgi:hypothetical protein
MSKMLSQAPAPARQSTVTPLAWGLTFLVLLLSSLLIAALPLAEMAHQRSSNRGTIVGVTMLFVIFGVPSLVAFVNVGRIVTRSVQLKADPPLVG